MSARSSLSVEIVSSVWLRWPKSGLGFERLFKPSKIEPEIPMSLFTSALRPAPALICFTLTAACANLPLTVERQKAPAEPPAPAFQMQDILGAKPSDIDALLGPPALTRVEGEGEFRRYTLKECELIIVLYPNDEGGKRATHIDTAARRSGMNKPDLSDCLAAG